MHAQIGHVQSNTQVAVGRTRMRSTTLCSSSTESCARRNWRLTSSASSCRLAELEA